MNGLLAVTIGLLACVAGGVAVYAGRRKQLGARPLLGYALAVALFLVASGLELISPSPADKTLWVYFRQVSSACLPVFSVILALQAIGRAPRLTRPVWAAALGGALLFLGLVITNPWHHLVWGPSRLLVDASGLVSLTYARGPLVWLNFTYLAALALWIGWGWLMSLGPLPGPDRVQGGLALAAILAPLGVYLLMPWLLANSALRPEPFLLTGAALAWAWCVFRFQYFGLAPVTPARVVETMQDPVFIIGPRGELVELNPAAQRLFQAAPRLGRPAAQALAEHPALAAYLGRTGVAQVELTLAGRPRQFDLRGSVVTDRSGRPAGNWLILHDYTERAEAARLRAAIYQIAQAAVSTQTLDDFLPAVHEVLETLMPARNFYIALLEDGGQRLVFPYFRDEREAAPEGQAVGHGLTGYVLRTRQPQWVPTEAFDRLVAAGEVEPVGPRPKDWLGAPLIAEGELFGALVVQSYSAGVHYGPAERDVLAFVGHQTALALLKIRALATAERRAQEAETLRRAGAAVAATLHQAEAVQRILDQLAQVVPYSTASIQLMRPGYLEIIGGHGWDDASVLAGLRFPVPGPNPNTLVVEQRRPLIIDDVRRPPVRYPGFLIDATATRTRCWLGVPLIIQGQVTGLLTLDSAEPDFFTPEHARLASAFADQVAVALENARLFAALQEQTEDLASLSRASAQLLGAKPDLDAVAQALVEAVALAVGSVHCGLGVVDEAGTHLVGTARSGAFILPHRLALPLDGPSLMAAAARQGEVIYVPDVQLDPRYLVNNPTTRTELVVPLYAAGRLIGVLNLESPAVDAFDERRRGLVAAFAERAALALENALLLKRLDEARQVAQMASALKSEFLANTSHELRTPLAGILGSIGLILDGYAESPEEERRFLQTAHQAGQQLLDMINALLDLSKIEAGKLDLHPEPVDVGAILAEVYSLLHIQAQLKQLKLELQLPEGPPPVAWADPHKVRQVIMNLVGNAVKFTEAGRITVSIRPDPAAGQLVVAVQDTGIGIAPEDQTKLFQPFVQADGSTTRKYGGTGLGLSISHRLAELMGGALTLYSAGPGQGATFSLTLPMTAAGAKAANADRPVAVRS